MKVPHGIGPAGIEEAVISGFDFRREQRVIAPPFWSIDVVVGRHDIEVAGHDHRGVETAQRGQMGLKPAEPGELEIEFGPRTRIAIRQIETGNEHPVDRCLYIAALAIGRIARQAAAGLVNFANSAEQRHAVPAALAMPDRLIAGALDLSSRKLVLGRFELLKTYDVRIS